MYPATIWQLFKTFLAPIAQLFNNHFTTNQQLLKKYLAAVLAIIQLFTIYLASI